MFSISYNSYHLSSEEGNFAEISLLSLFLLVLQEMEKYMFYSHLIYLINTDAVAYLFFIY